MKNSWATLVISAATSIALFNISAAAVVTALDNASRSAYSDGWATGDNGGFGFGAWTLETGTGNSYFIGNSANNGSASNATNINTSGNKAFGLFSRSSGPAGDTASAYRSITSPLSVGQTFSISIDNGYADSGSAMGFGLQTSSGTNRFELYFKGGAPDYKINAGGGEQNTGIGYTEGGLRIDFKLLSGGNAADVRVVRLSSGTETFFSNLSLASSGSIARVRAFNFRAGNNSSNDFFVNSMTIPEPTSFGLLAVGAGWMVSRRNRKKQQ